MLDLPLAAIADICRRYGIGRLALFGSALTNDFEQDSDIDLLDEWADGTRADYFALMDMQEELEQLLGRRVDLVPREGLHWSIRHEILSAARTLYAA